MAGICAGVGVLAIVASYVFFQPILRYVMDVTSEAMQILGGPGYMNESVTSRLPLVAPPNHRRSCRPPLGRRRPR